MAGSFFLLNLYLLNQRKKRVEGVVGTNDADCMIQHTKRKLEPKDELQFECNVFDSSAAHQQLTLPYPLYQQQKN